MTRATSKGSDYEVPLEDAVSRLVVRDGYVHTFVMAIAGGILLGADWSIDKVHDCMEEFGVEESGDMASAMKHTLTSLRDEDGPVFFEADRYEEVRD